MADKAGLQELSDKLLANTQSELTIEASKNDLMMKMMQLKSIVEKLEADAIKIKESNLDGAFQIVNESNQKSLRAEEKVKTGFLGSSVTIS